jgi:hypothetical protein
LIWKNLSIHLGFNSKYSIDLDYSLKGFIRHAFWKLISNQDVVGKFQPHNMNIYHPTLRFMHHWISMTLFARNDIHLVFHAEMKLLYAIHKKTKVAPIKEIFNHWIDTIRPSTAISCSSLVTRIAASVDALDGKNVTYISTPCIKINEHFLMQGHHLKYDDAGNLVFYFSRYTNEIQLPNLELLLYKSPTLTFTLVEQEEAHRNLASRRSTWSRKRNEVGSSQQPPPTSTPPVPQTHMSRWLPAMHTSRFTSWYQPSCGYTLHPLEAGGPGWHEVRGFGWHEQQAHSSNSKGLPPLVHPRQSTSDRRELGGINTSLGGLELRTGEIQNTLNTHMQSTTQWHQQQQ